MRSEDTICNVTPAFRRAAATSLENAMTDESSNRKAGSDVLNAEQEVTLRRVAFGESPARTLRSADLAYLRALHMIEDGKDGPVLTAKGRKHHAGLPRAPGTAHPGQQDDLLGALSKALRDVKR
jgi:hypothetical protein